MPIKPYAQLDTRPTGTSLRPETDTDPESTGLSPSRLIGSSPRLAATLANVLSIGSSHGSLFDRQNLGVTTSRAALGPPGRVELNEVDEPRVTVINLAANSYLGLADDPRIRDAAIAALHQYGTHTGGSRLLCGTAQIHYELERQLASFFKARSVVTYSSGYVSNVSVISSLFGPEDLVILDRNAHRSLYDGAMLSRAAVRRFAHNDLSHLELILSRTSRFPRRLVAVDGVYSMEGHVASVPELIELTHRHGAFLLVDDAHAIGVLGPRGRGTFEHFGADPDAVDIRIGTLSKAIPSVGGFASVSGDVAVVLRYASSAAVFSASLTPPDVAVAMEAISIMEAEPERIARVRENAAFFRRLLEERGLDTMGSQSAVIPVRIGDRVATLDVAAALLKRGIFLNPVISPGVPRGAERLRCFVMASHTPADLDYAADTICQVFRSKGLGGR